jgi:5'-deoxynucleotidase YfbR-like HD superfamily hydrolase
MNRFDMMIAGGMVERFHTGQTITTRTVGQHTFNMLVIADNVFEGETPDWLSKAILYHDLHEVFTGDIPWPVKQRPALKEAIDHMEHEINVEYGLTVKLTDVQYRMLKAIDMLEFLLYLMQERALGNSNHPELMDRAADECHRLLEGDDIAPFAVGFWRVFTRLLPQI